MSQQSTATSTGPPQKPRGTPRTAKNVKSGKGKGKSQRGSK